MVRANSSHSTIRFLGDRSPRASAARAGTALQQHAVRDETACADGSTRPMFSTRRSLDSTPEASSAPPPKRILHATVKVSAQPRQGTRRHKQGTDTNEP